MSTQRQQSDRFENYVPVAERVEQFYAKFESGRIITTIVTHDVDSGFILIRAEVFRLPDDAQPAATGHAYEIRGEGYVNKTSYVENCETGAVGRALALLGFEVKRGIASREEMQKASRQQPARVPSDIKTAPNAPANVRAVAEETEGAHLARNDKVVALREVLGAVDEDLTVWHNKRHGTSHKDWRDATLAQKDDIVAQLEAQLPKR